MLTQIDQNLIINNSTNNYENKIHELFDEIKSNLLDLDILIETEYYYNPERHEKLVFFKEECLEIFEEIQEELQNISFHELEEGDADICYQCAEIIKNMYSLLKKLIDDRPKY